MKKEAYGWGGDAYPGEEPDAVANNDANLPRQDYSQQSVPDRPIYHQWVYVNGHVVMDSERTPEQLVDDHGFTNTSKPLAYGRVAVQHRWSANFQIIHSNIGLNPVMKALKGYAKEQGWNDIGFVDHNGHEFGIDRVASDVGTGWQTVPKDWVNTEKNPNSDQQDGEFFKNPAADKPRSGLYECPHCGEEMDNYGEFREHLMGEKDAIATPNNAPDVAPIDLDKTIPADWNNSTSPDWVMMMSHTANTISVGAIPDDMMAGYRGVARRMGQQKYYGEGARHQVNVEPFETNHPYHKDVPGVASFVDVFHQPDHNRIAIAYAHTDPSQRQQGHFKRLIQHVYDSYPDMKIAHGDRMHDASDKVFHEMREQYPERTSRTAAPKVKLPGPIPFIFDIDQDRVYVGFPGEEIKDVQAGDYNPLGIVEGLYKPTGEVEIQTQTNMPYTIRHMIQLWYYLHPELEVKSVVMIYEDGGKQKLAGALPFVHGAEGDSVAYHGAPSSARNSIQTQGLKMNDLDAQTLDQYGDNSGWDRPAGVYVAETLEKAIWFGSNGGWRTDFDVWEVNIEGLPVDWEADAYHDAGIVLQDIPPDRLRLGQAGDEPRRAKTSMAIRPTQLDEWMKANGPYMVHWTKPEHVDSIMQQGVKPWVNPYMDDRTDPNMYESDEEWEEAMQQEDGPTANWGGSAATRPGHVYMATPDNTDVLGMQNGKNESPFKHPIHVDLRQLDPTKFKADEDWARAAWNKLRPKDVEEDDWSMDGPPYAQHWDADGESLGDWAEREGLGDPDWVHDSLIGHADGFGGGSLAYEGAIPPEALRQFGGERLRGYGQPQEYHDFMDEWRGYPNHDENGQPKYSSMDDMDEVPPEPGTTPLPDPTHMRLYHYTNSLDTFEAIKREGIKNSAGAGESYGEPSQIWASNRMPGDHKAFFEFSMPADDPRIDIGKFYPYTNEDTGGHHTPETWAKYMAARGSDVTIPYGDIAPHEILAAHLPWHRHYRYLKQAMDEGRDIEDMLSTDWTGHEGGVKDAVDRINRERGKMSKVAAAPDNVGEQVRDLLQQDPSAVEVYNALSPLGNVYVVGGAIRDLALGRIPKDIDIMAQGISPDDVIKALKLRPGRVEVTGNQFPVIRYFHPSGEQCEIALPRRERSTGGGGRKDFDVQMDIDMPVEEDLERRDFTGNSMAVDLKTGQLIDPYGGWRDLEEGKLKLVHPNAFQDDATRILRALSSKSRHGLHPDNDTQQAMNQWAHRIDTHVPAEQKSAELDKLMKGDDPASALELAQQTGVLEHIIPELAATHGFDQKSKYHDELLFDHIMSVLRKTAELNKDPDVRMAAALHDIGKPGSQWFDDEGYGHYYKKVHKPGTLDENGLPKANQGKDHEHHGADLARDRLKELTWGNKERQERVEHLVRSHMFPSFEDDKGARKFLHKYDPDDVGHASDLLDIREADAGNKAEPWDGVLGMQRSLVQSARDQGAATNLSQLAINGGDVMRALDMMPGKEVGEALQYCQEIVLEDPSMNEKATLIEALKARGGQRMANVLDPVQETLDADVFDNADKAKPKVKIHIVQWVRKQLETLLKANDYGDIVPHIKLVMTGSLTSYQWSHKSDFDVSVWLDYSAFPNLVRADMISLMVNEMDGTLVPGTTHMIQCYIVPNGLMFEDLYKPGLRSAYDLDKNKWIIAPEPDRVYNPYAEVPALMGWVHDQAEKMKLLQNYDPPGAREFERQIHQRRARDQQAGKGDFSESNVLWKYLEHMELV